MGSNVLETVLVISLSLFLALASDIVGSKITDNELVIVEGNIIKDIAIPVSIPYILNEVL